MEEINSSTKIINTNIDISNVNKITLDIISTLIKIKGCCRHHDVVSDNHSSYNDSITDNIVNLSSFKNSNIIIDYIKNKTIPLLKSLNQDSNH